MDRCWCNPRFFLIATVALVALLAFVYVGVHRMPVEYTALHAFLNSRPGQYDSRAFITRGVKCGMTIEEVDSLMSDAYKRTPLIKQTFPATGDFFKLYFFRYGPPLLEPFGGKEYLYEESVTVYFDEDRRAHFLERDGSESAQIGWRYYTFDTEIDLCPGDND